MTRDSLTRALTDVQGGNPLGTTGRALLLSWVTSFAVALTPGCVLHGRGAAVTEVGVSAPNVQPATERADRSVVAADGRGRTGPLTSVVPDEPGSASPAAPRVRHSVPYDFRPVGVAFAVDAAFREVPEWRVSLDSWIERVNDMLLSADAGLCLTISDVLAWDHSARIANVAELYDELRGSGIGGEADVVVGMSATMGTSERLGASRDVGCCMPFGRFVVVHLIGPEDPDWEFGCEVLAHELCHVFGAFHIDDERTVMRSSSSGAPVLELDRGTLAVLRAYRLSGVPIGRGVEALSKEQIEAITDSFVARHAPGEKNPVVVALIERARELAACGRDPRERAVLSRALEVNRRSGGDQSRTSESLEILLGR